MNSLIRSVLRLCCAAPLLFGVAFAGCAKQGEGERCDATNSGSEDCEPGLVCVRAEDLKDRAADRCCPESAADDRCRRRPIGTAGTGGNDDAGNDSSSEAADGAAEAEAGLVCESGNCGDAEAGDAVGETQEADTMDSPDDTSDGAGGNAGAPGDATGG